MKIPTQFQLMGSTIRVVQIDHMEHDKMGEWIGESLEIRLYPLGRRWQVIEHTFCHELTHALLDMLNEDELSSNEKLVDLLGGLLHQFMNSAEYES